MAGLLFNKFKGDKVRVLLVRGIREMLQALRGIILQVRQGLLSATIVRGNGIWQGSALSLRGQGILHGSKKRCCCKMVLMANLSSYGLDVLSEIIQWRVNKKGNGPRYKSTTYKRDKNGFCLFKSARRRLFAREIERKARTALLMSIPEDHLAKFHKITDAKEIWEAIKFKFGGNDESKKMHKYILKQQFESFLYSNLEKDATKDDSFHSSLLVNYRFIGTGDPL
ncbi:hypothetical protein Tco_0102970 [Tanacetum coccineum]